MKKMKKVRFRLILILAFLVWVIFGGMMLIYREIVKYGITVPKSLRPGALRLVLGGGLVFAGVLMLVILFLYLFRRAARIQKEAEALREKNEAMEALNQQTQKLAHHQRLETMGTLTSSIAHEFNNLLTPIMGYSMMALEKLPAEEEELYDDILEIYNASRKAKVIISRLSDLARKNPVQAFKTVSPDELVRRTLDVVAPAQPPKVEVKVSLDCWDQRIRANEIQMQQLLMNLILNGFQAMQEKGGMLTVNTSFDEVSVHIRVSDTGCGIPKELIPRIFEPFFTTKEPGTGTGLGLAIVAQVVEDHRGSIDVESAEGEGTSITVSLPRAQRQEEE